MPPAAGTVAGATSTQRRSPSPTPEPSDKSSCEPIAGVLERFRRAYNTGALDRLMALYSAAAQENETRGRSGIRQLYLRWFDQTSERRIAFSGADIHLQGEGRCGARAGFSVRYRDAQGRWVDRTGTITILFDGRGADARILRISY
jgi:ketosteroid isomerase-like protein